MDRMRSSALAAIGVGIALGAVLFTLGFAEAGSYLGDDPASCANCHIMRGQYEGWVRSSHRAVAVCNDCHAPHALVPKYAVKALNGVRHSVAFTFGGFPEPIRITPLNRAVTEAQCRMCHAEIAHGIDRPAAAREEVACMRCHSEVGHRN